jgi:hypothetical protein
MTAPDTERLTPAPERSADRRRLHSKLTPLQWLEVAGIVVVLVAVSPAVVRQFAAFAVPDSSGLTAFLPLSDSTAAELLGQPVWGPVRGDGEGELSAGARAIRVGAAIASFELRQRRADPAAAESAREVATLLDTFRKSADAASAYRALGVNPRDDALVRSAGRLAEQTGGRRPVRLGAWLQNARFAAAASDSSFFGGDVGGAVSRAAITMDDRPDTEHAARQFEQILRERPYDWAAISTAAEELLRLLGTLP